MHAQQLLCPPPQGGVRFLIFSNTIKPFPNLAVCLVWGLVAACLKGLLGLWS